MNDAADDLEDGTAWQAYAANRHAVCQARPVTLAGIIAKARAAKVEATMPDRSVHLSGTPGEDWARDILDDLLALAPYIS